MRKFIRRATFAALAAAPALACAWGAAGHEYSGALADALLKPRAAQQVRQILGIKLRVASTWADCVKDVGPNAAGVFSYTADPRFHAACAAFEDTSGRARMVDFVRRNWANCASIGVPRACHKEYHFADVAIQHSRYDRGFIGTGPQDVVGLLQAAVAVLQGHAAPAPFSIKDKKEALLLLAHMVGDVHQPLHVGSVYLDVSNRPVDPDIKGPPVDPKTFTRGGNSIDAGFTNLHAEWDAAPRGLKPLALTAKQLAAAKAVAATPGAPLGWPKAWASDTVALSRQAFDGLRFARDPQHPTQWSAQFLDRVAYMKAKDQLQAQQLSRAGARLAQLLNAVWP